MGDVDTRIEYLQGQVTALQLAIGALLASHPEPRAAAASIADAVNTARRCASSAAAVLGVESSERRFRTSVGPLPRGTSAGRP